jgi:hypothetical protein
MPTIRERLANVLLGDEKEKLQETARILMRAIQEGPYLFTPDVLVEQLKEVDSAILTDLLLQLQYEQMGSMGYNPAQTDAERVRSIDESRRQYKYDVVVQWIIHLWTDFGFGENISVVPEDDNAKDVWSEFWSADRNANILSDDELSFLSEDLLVDGEKFLTFYIATDGGESTLRDIDTKEITALITAPGDDRNVLFYKRTWNEGSFGQEMYYPDWMALVTGELEKEYTGPKGETKTYAEWVLPKNAKRADEVQDGTTVCMLHVAHNRKGELRGWPLMTAGIPWSREHKRFRENRATLAAAVASFVRKTKVKGGSRAIEAVRAKLTSTLSPNQPYETNPPAAPGSTLLENDAADTTTFPLTTAAGDAEIDGNSLLQMAGLGGGVFLHWLGSGEAFRLATATAMEVPLLREFTRYQMFWASQFRKMVRIVLWADETYGSKHEYETYDATVSTDKLLQNDLGVVSSAIGSMTTQALVPALTAGIVQMDTAKRIQMEIWRSMLSTMGVKNVDELINDTTFAVEPLAQEAGEAIPAPAIFGGNVRNMTAQEKIQMALSSIQDLRGTIDKINVPDQEMKVTVNYLSQLGKITGMTETQVIKRNPDTGEIVGAEATQYVESLDKAGVKKTRIVETRTVRRDPYTGRIIGVDAVRQYEDEKGSK